MVSNDVMRLEVKRLRETLNGAADEVFSLENRRQQLALSMKERKAEIQVMAKVAFSYAVVNSCSRHSRVFDERFVLFCWMTLCLLAGTS